MPDTSEQIDREAYLETRLRHAERLNQVLFMVVHLLEDCGDTYWKEGLNLPDRALLAAFMSDEYLARSYG